AIDNARLWSRALTSLDADRQRLRDVLGQVPAAVALLRGPDHVIEFANETFLASARGREAVGLPFGQAFPELAAGDEWPLLEEAWRTGKPVVRLEGEITIAFGDVEPQPAYFNWSLHPVRGADGRMEGLLLHAIEVTDQVRARRRVEALAADLRSLADASAAI